jgi:hypothetical protein
MDRAPPTKYLVEAGYGHASAPRFRCGCRRRFHDGGYQVRYRDVQAGAVHRAVDGLRATEGFPRRAMPQWPDVFVQLDERPHEQALRQAGAGRDRGDKASSAPCEHGGAAYR